MLVVSDAGVGGVDATPYAEDVASRLSNQPDVQEEQQALGTSRDEKSPGGTPSIRLRYTVPNGMSFEYQGQQLRFVDTESSRTYALKQGVTPPAIGLRARVMFGCTAPGPAAEASPSHGRSYFEAIVDSSMPLTCIDDLPDTVLALIGQLLLHSYAAQDAVSEAAAAAAVLACTGSRAALIIAHSIWTVLMPSSDVLVQRLRQVAAGVPAQYREIEAKMERRFKQEVPVEALKALRQQHDAAAALIVFADPLHCPLPSALLKPLRWRHREKVASELLDRHDLTVDSLPNECGIKTCAQAWIRTGCVNGVQHGSALAVSMMIAQVGRLRQLHALTGIHSATISKNKRCQEYVKSGLGSPAPAVQALCHDLQKESEERRFAAAAREECLQMVLSRGAVIPE